MLANARADVGHGAGAGPGVGPSSSNWTRPLSQSSRSKRFAAFLHEGGAALTQSLPQSQGLDYGDGVAEVKCEGQVAAAVGTSLSGKWWVARSQRQFELPQLAYDSALVAHLALPTGDPGPRLRNALPARDLSRLVRHYGVQGFPSAQHMTA